MRDVGDWLTASGEKGSVFWVLVAAILGSSMVFIDGTVVNVALPALQAGLHATLSDVQWVVEAYALFLAALLLVGGSLGDLYGRRKIFLAGTLLFAGASVWCGFAPDIHHLIAARSLQGIGGALLVPGSLALISTSFSAEDRGRAIGTWSGFTAITASIGPVVGGWLVQHGSWRWVFFLNVPIAIAVVSICLLRVAQDRVDQQSPAHLDWAGAALATIGLGGVVFALIEWTRGGWVVWSAAGIGLAALLGLAFVEQRVPSPMLPFQLFRSRNFAGANLLTLFLYAGLGGVLFFFPLDLIQVQHYSATQAGAALLPLIVLIFLLSRWSGGLVARFGAKPPLIIGPLIAAVGFALFAVPPMGHSYWAMFFPAVITLGLGLAIAVAPLTTTVMGAVPQSRVGVGSGINNAVSRVASLLAVAVLGLLLSTSFNHSLDQRLDSLRLPPAVREKIDSQKPQLAAIQSDNPAIRAAVAAAFLDGYRRVQWLAAALAVLSAITAALLIRSDPRSESNSKTSP
jgi:EmrB/QacA subfamily drug resistance transporter